MDSPDWLTVGGWHAPSARVLADAVIDGLAAVLVDTNGDGRELWFEVARHDDTEGWEIVHSDADVSETWISESGGLVTGWGTGEPGEPESQARLEPWSTRVGTSW
jgi:hypothetical protein